MFRKSEEFVSFFVAWHQFAFGLSREYSAWHPGNAKMKNEGRRRDGDHGRMPHAYKEVRYCNILLISHCVVGTMVLAELGGKLRDSLRKLHSHSGHVTQQTLKDLLSEITRALIESDVNVKLVMQLRDNVSTKVQSLIEDDEDGDEDSERRASNISKHVQKVVVEELTNLLNPERKPYKMERGRANVILFVGLQGAGKVSLAFPTLEISYQISPLIDSPIPTFGIVS